MKLVVLSEIHCLHYLTGIGVKPNEYYTDFDEFKNHLAYFINVKVVIILGGTCAFGKRRVLDLYTTILSRAEDSKDTGIQSVYLLSDVVLPSCESYYFYENEPIYCQEYSYTKPVGNPISLLERVEHDSTESIQVHLSEAHNGHYVSDARAKTKSELENDELVNLIKVPTLP